MRILRTCRAMGISTVAVYSEADRRALHVRLADEAVAIGPSAASESYLRIDRILEAAEKTGAEAIHPGYGFLSENPALAEACEQAGLRFIGPSAASMRLMGSKTAAREAMIHGGVPVVPGSTRPLANLEEALRAAEQTAYPTMLKAAAGGGGKGMRLVHSAAELPSAFEQARNEALRAFGNGEVYIEKAIVRPRHVEVQILADHHGAVIHLGERECSLQRRHQKVVEESPSPFVEQQPELRERLTAAAVKAAQAAAYRNAGTVEFLVDASGAFYFLEMNTRLQVEHPVTELVTGLDLVREQICIAAGEPLRYRQEEIAFRGSAMECRIYAEDPDHNFFPSPGRITVLEEPQGPGIRVDSGSYEGWSVPVEYDPLIAKLVAWGQTRSEAIDRLRGALREYHIGGIKTTIPFFAGILADPEFREGRIDTGFIERWFQRQQSSGERPGRSPEDEAVAVLAAGLHFLKQRGAPDRPAAGNGSTWKTAGRHAMLRGDSP